MRTCLLAVCLALGLAACGEPVPPLTAAEKARFVAELIEGGAECDGLRHRLAQPDLPREAIDRLYGEAKLQRCIKKDV